MATPLMWETCRYSNSIYGSLLRYPMPLQIDTEKRSFRIERQEKRLITFYFSLFVICSTVTCILDVILEVCVFKSLVIPRHTLLIQIAAAFLSVFCVCLFLAFQRFSDDVWENWFSKSVLFEEKVLQNHKSQDQNKISVIHQHFWILLISGIIN